MCPTTRHTPPENYEYDADGQGTALQIQRHRPADAYAYNNAGQVKAAAFCRRSHRINTLQSVPNSNVYSLNFRNRFYDPSLGRFISQDPLGMVDGPNMYNFCGGDPVNHRDPMGTTLEVYGANWNEGDIKPGVFEPRIERLLNDMIKSKQHYVFNSSFEKW